MKILVLGSGAGGELGGASRTQSAVAVSQDGDDWVLLNASSDLSQQVRANTCLHPRAGTRESPIRAIVLLDAQLQNVAGLLSLHELNRLEVYATPQVFEDLTAGLPLLSVLEHYSSVHWHMLPVAGETAVATFRIEGFPMLRFSAVSVPSRAPRHARPRGEMVGEGIALQIEDVRSGQRFFYSPSLATVGADELDWMRNAHCLMVDAGAPRDDGVIHVLNATGATRKILTHVDRDDPILDEGGTQRRTLHDHGIEVAHDGMVIEL